MNYLQKDFRKKIPGISGITGGAVLFLLLFLALTDDPAAGNLWLALFISVLMMVAGVAALRSSQQQKGPGEGVGKGRTTS